MNRNQWNWRCYADGAEGEWIAADVTVTAPSRTAAVQQARKIGAERGLPGGTVYVENAGPVTAA